MMSDLDLQQMDHFVLSKQHLADETKGDDVVQVVNDVFGFEGQIFQTRSLR